MLWRNAHLCGRGFWMLLAGLFILHSGAVVAAPGDWPEPRQNSRLTAIQSLPGNLKSAPVRLATFDMGHGFANVSPINLSGKKGWLGIAVVNGSLSAYRPDGSLVWQIHPAGLNFSQLCAVGDFDGSGHLLLAMQAGRPTAPLGAVVLVRAEDGRIVWRYDVDPMSYDWKLMAGEYLPGARGQQLIVLMHGYPPDAKNGYIALFHFPKPGQPPMQKWRYDFDHYTCFPQLYQVNLRGNGRRELAVISHSRMWLFEPASGHKDQFVQWDVSPANIRSYGLNEFVDLAGHGHDDFLCIANFAQHHEVLLNDGGKFHEAWHQGWDESVVTGHVETTWPVPAHGIVDRGGRQSVVVSMFDSEGKHAWLIRVYDAVSGKLQYSMPSMIAESLIDIDGDGKLEILADRTDDPTAAQPDGSATISDHRGACLLKVVGDRLQIVWEDKHARAIRGATQQGPQVRLNGLPAAITHAGGRFQAVSMKSIASRPTTPDFSKVQAVVGPIEPQLLAADYFNAGRNDLLVYHDDTATIVRPQTNGSMKTLATYQSACLPAVADIDGSGKLALILTDLAPGEPPVLRAVSPAAGGKILWEASFPGEPEGNPAPRPAYLRTGHFTGRRGQDVYVWLGSPAVRSMVLDGRDGHVVWHKQRIPPIERYWGPSVNLASVWPCTKGGNDDLVFTNPDYYCVASGKTGQMLLGPTSPEVIFHQPNQGLYTLPAILASHPTAGGDPTVCLVAGHYFQAALSLHGKPFWFNSPSIPEARSGREGFARRANGQWLMGFGQNDGKFACVDAASGKTQWEFEIGASCSDTISCDIDKSGEATFIVGTSHGQLLALEDHGDRATQLWSLNVGTPILGAPIAADILGTGRSQIIACGSDGVVRIFGPPR